MPKETSLYSRLGVPTDASPEEVRRAYREAARKLHPDINQKPGETELFIGIQEAYDILSNPDQRMAYDNNLSPDVFAQPVQVNTLYSRASLTRSKEPQLIYVLLELTARPDSKKPIGAPPLNTSLVIDCSTSMQGVIMDTVKSTAIELLHQMRAEDIISIVAFSDRAEVVLPAGSQLNAKQIEMGIRMLQSRGGTEIFRGLEAAYHEIARFRDDKHTNQIILITDGRTYGDEADCIKLAQQASIEGVEISGLGIGDKWNDEFMDKLTSITGGSSIYVTTPKDIRDYLKDKFHNLSQRYAENVKLDYNKPANVDLRYVFRIQPETMHLATGSPIQIGSIPREASANLLMEFLVTSLPAADRAVLLPGRFFLEVPLQAKSQISIRLELERPITKEPDRTPPPAALVQAMSKLTIYRMQERARQEISQGKVKDATRHLQNIATRLMADGQNDLARTVLKEIGHVEKKQALSDGGGKRIKYGTRGLVMLPATVKQNE